MSWRSYSARSSVCAPDHTDGELTAIAIVGAESALVTAYLAGRIDITRDRLIDHLTELHLTAAGITTATAPQ
ncbi:MAG: hypothetical protein ACRDQ7_10015 [Haloechinothrix sp.]